MHRYKKYPVLEVNLEAIRNNARVMREYCMARGVSIAGVVKVSDGDLRVARALYEGGCTQLAASRIVHLKQIKQALPQVETMLIRIPTPSEAAEVVRDCDISLNPEADTLRALNSTAGRLGKVHGVVLMLDVGDLREGVTSEESLLPLALLVERALPNLRLMGTGTTYACFGGLMPTQETSVH